jgi:aspartate-semialdehyde dehydrogenase
MANIAIVGVTGIVGIELLKLIENASFFISKLNLYASDTSFKRALNFQSKKILVKKLSDANFKEEDLVFFCTPKDISYKYVPIALKANTLVIDLSTAFRNNQNSSLCVPEIIQDSFKNFQLFSSPNCVATIMSLVLFPLDKLFKLKTVVASTYQAISGGGYKLLNTLLDDTKAELNEGKTNSSAFNVYLHNSKIFHDGYNFEEKKIISELKILLKHPNLSISVTAVRVPTIRCHSISCHLTFENKVNVKDARNALKAAKGIKIIDSIPFASCNDAKNQKNIFCSRIRKIPYSNNILELWIVGDQLLKGAALNAYQIAEHLLSHQNKVLKQDTTAFALQDA